MDTSTHYVPTTTPETYRLSDTFRSTEDAVTFISSNNVGFKIRRMSLNIYTSVGFAQPSNSEDLSVSAESEPVHLLEHSDILEILFQFIEPPSESRNFRQPNVVGLESTVFFGVAEAAEKYVVYGAINVCVTRMRQIIDEYPLEVLNHCAKHGYPELGDLAAEASLSIPLRKVAVKLTEPGLLMRWLIYYGSWRQQAAECARRFEHYAPRDCAVWTELCLRYLRQVNKDPTTLNQRPVVDGGVHSRCTGSAACSCRLLPSWPRWEKDVFVDMRQALQFSKVTGYQFL
ncbi:hypothetical protein BDN70DRAFT_866216 [Pholiota conissans]|uniref:BTB domain-containing protein n=1 Tax=Pholiota conissans TaxID=109636 RepID=A0A9P6CWC6_9AGAR|nr:hypothetical protein BDN70DRAFT_866216 [Pholiota conissans]